MMHGSCSFDPDMVGVLFRKNAITGNKRQILLLCSSQDEDEYPFGLATEHRCDGRQTQDE